MNEESTFISENSGAVMESTKPLKVLLIDDKQENLLSLEALLEDVDHDIHFIKCISGNEALSVALKVEIALILLDVQMPGMDGYEVAMYLKANKRTRSIPIIFVTALDQETNYILEGYEKGAIDYLFKPLNPAITRAKVKAFIDAYLQQKELERKNLILQNLAMLVNNSNDVMCILKSDTLEIVKINPAWEKTFGLVENEIIERPILSVEGFEKAFLPLKEAMGEIVEFENNLSNRFSDENRWFSWSFVKRNGFWYGNGKNITKNKQIEEQLETANEVLERRVMERTADLLAVNAQLKDEIKKREKAEEVLQVFNERLMRNNEELDSFVYIASHDLKAPIANLEMLFTLLRKKIGDKVAEGDLKLFDLVDQSLEKFHTILKDLGKITTIQQDLQDEYTQINLQEVYNDVIGDIKQLVDESSATITTDFEIETIVYARKHVRSIFYNLLSNAIKYRAPERFPEIRVRSYEEKESIVLSVKDNGRGLSSSQKERMFSLFQRFHKDVEGSGIGLYMLRKIITNSGGSIAIESKEGMGTEFKVYLKKADVN